MPGFESRYFRKGVDNQKRADVTVVLKRPEAKDIQKMSLSQRLSLVSFINDADKFFKDFKKEIIRNVKKWPKK
jgi:hypothetical protein